MARLTLAMPFAQVGLKIVCTGIRWIGARGPRGGLTAVTVDAGLPQTVDISAEYEDRSLDCLTVSGFADSWYTIRVAVHSDNARGKEVTVFYQELINHSRSL